MPAEQQFTTTITISEIVYGAQKSDRPELHMRNLETVLLPAINVLGFDVKAAYIAGRDPGVSGSERTADAVR